MVLKKRYSRERGRDYVLRILKDNIVSLELEPGSRISENDLALELGVSRTPIREALIELSKIKIVEIYPQKGSYVSVIDWNLVEEAQFTRLTLEKAIVRLMCSEIKEERLADLEENVKLQQFYVDNNRIDELLELDNQFHRELFEITNKSYVYQLMSEMIIHFDRLRTLRSKTVNNQHIVDDHLEILDAIRRKDPESAEKMVEKHLTRHAIDEEIIRNKYPKYFRTKESLT